MTRGTPLNSMASAQLNIERIRRLVASSPFFAQVDKTGLIPAFEETMKQIELLHLVCATSPEPVQHSVTELKKVTEAFLHNTRKSKPVSRTDSQPVPQVSGTTRQQTRITTKPFIVNKPKKR